MRRTAPKKHKDRHPNHLPSLEMESTRGGTSKHTR
jgi:hypothetical protein